MYCKARNKRYRKETLGSFSDFVGVKSTAFQSNSRLLAPTLYRR